MSEPRATVVASNELLAASIALKEYLEGPECVIEGFDVPDEIWRPFVIAIDACETSANPSFQGGGTL